MIKQRVRQLLRGRDPEQRRQAIALAAAALPPAEAAALLLKAFPDTRDLPYEILLAYAPAEAADRAARLSLPLSRFARACDCAERVVPLFEAARPGDPRPREGVEAARRYAREGLEDEIDLGFVAYPGYYAAQASGAAARSDAREALSGAQGQAISAVSWAVAAGRRRPDPRRDKAARAAAKAERAWQRERFLGYLAALLAEPPR